MSLTEESRTILKLVVARGQSYAEIAALLGIDEPGARDRAHSALSELADSSGFSPDPEVADFLLGQTDQLQAAGVERRIADDPELSDQVERIEDQLKLVAPAGSRRGGNGTTDSRRRQPRKPRTRAEASPPPATPTAPVAPPAEASAAPRGLTASQRRLVAILLGAALLAAILILVLTGVIGGSDKNDAENSNPAATTASLVAVDGESGEGTAQIGFNAQGGLAVNLQATDLAPNRKGETYALWFDGTKGAFPVDQSLVGEEGSIARQIPLIGPEICLVADGVFRQFTLTRVGEARLKRDVQARRKNRNDQDLPGAIGKPVLAGEISMPQDARDQIIRQCSGTAQNAG